MGIEGILRRHAPAHDGIDKGFPLSGVEPQDLVVKSVRSTDGSIRHLLSPNQFIHHNLSFPFPN